MTPLELEEIATFYGSIYREPVGKYVIDICDGVVCWMQNHQSVFHEISARLGIQLGETTPDGLFSLLPACCIGYCAPGSGHDDQPQSVRRIDTSGEN